MPRGRVPLRPFTSAIVLTSGENASMRELITFITFFVYRDQRCFRVIVQGGEFDQVADILRNGPAQGELAEIPVKEEI